MTTSAPDLPKDQYVFIRKLQQGLRLAIGSVTPQPARELQMKDFEVKRVFGLEKYRDRDTSYQLPSWSFSDYAPRVFRHFRALFGVDAAGFLMSLCGDDCLVPMGSAGKSGCVFLRSADSRYI
ncbi:phosphatidylinositol-4-phosphate 5-kinase, partial [Kipferlia bialata]|eukprot:g11301.t1